MSGNNLEAIAQALVAPGKGILAADESLPTIEKRFKSINVPSTHWTIDDKKLRTLLKSSCSGAVCNHQYSRIGSARSVCASTMGTKREEQIRRHPLTTSRRIRRKT